MLPIQVIYTENGEEKTSLDEHKKRVQILRLNQELIERCNKEKEQEKIE